MASTIKRVRIDPNETLKELKEMFDRRMHALERKMEFLINTCTTILGSCDLHSKAHGNSPCCAQLLLPKIKVIDNYIKSVNTKENSVKEKSESTTPIVFLLNESQSIELNSEQDIPSGSWLGDQDDPKARVRVKISPEKLEEINGICPTPVKMALTLLDVLFPKEVLAVSNLSGKGKHCKKQLDPILVYGIKCHLIFKFSITERDWTRIKQNIDSKCRAIWKKFHMRLVVTNNNNNNSNTNDNSSINNEVIVEDFSNDFLMESEKITVNLNNAAYYSRSNSPLKNINPLPSIMEEDSELNDISEEEVTCTVEPSLLLIENSPECLSLDTSTDPDLIPDKLFGDGILDCHTNLDV